MKKLKLRSLFSIVLILVFFNMFNSVLAVDLTPTSTKLIKNQLINQSNVFKTYSLESPRRVQWLYLYRKSDNSEVDKVGPPSWTAYKESFDFPEILCDSSPNFNNEFKNYFLENYYLVATGNDFNYAPNWNSREEFNIINVSLDKKITENNYNLYKFKIEWNEYNLYQWDTDKNEPGPGIEFFITVKGNENGKILDSESITPAKISLNIKKVISTNDESISPILINENDYSFVIEPNSSNPNDDPISENLTVETKGNNKDSEEILKTDELEFIRPGIYNYTIKEIVPEQSSKIKGIIYDDTIHNLGIEIERNELNELTATTYLDEQSFEYSIDFIEFENIFEPNLTSVDISADLTIDNFYQAVSNETFKFELKPRDDSNESEKVVAFNNLNSITFNNLYFRKPGEYDYVLNQVNLGDERFEYDNTEYLIKINVAYENEVLEAHLIYFDVNDNPVNNIIFNNRYIGDQPLGNYTKDRFSDLSTLLVGNLFESDSKNPLKGANIEKTKDNLKNNFTLGIASQFSIFIQNDFTVYESDTEGRAAVGGIIKNGTGWDYQIGLGDYSYGTPLNKLLGTKDTATIITSGYKNISSYHSDYSLGDGYYCYDSTDCAGENGHHKGYDSNLNPSDSEKLLVINSETYNPPGNDSTNNILNPDQQDGSRILPKQVYITPLIDFDKSFDDLKETSKNLSNVKSNTFSKNISTDNNKNVIEYVLEDNLSSANCIYLNLSKEEFEEFKNADIVKFKNIPKLPTARNGIDNAGNPTTWNFAYIVVNIRNDYKNEINPNFNYETISLGKTHKTTYINNVEIGNNTPDLRKNNNIGCSSLLYNFADAKNIILGGNFQGTILAPYAHVTDQEYQGLGGSRGHLSGALVAESFIGRTEFGYRPFDSLVEEIPNNENSSNLKITKSQSILENQKTTGKVSVEAGDEITYYLTVHNDSNETVNNVEIKDTIPQSPISLEYINNSATTKIEGKSLTFDFDLRTKTLKWIISQLNPKEEITVEFKVLVPNFDNSKILEWRNLAFVSGDNSPEKSSNAVNAETTINNDDKSEEDIKTGGLSLTKLVSNPTDEDLDLPFIFDITLIPPEEISLNTFYNYSLNIKNGDNIDFIENKTLVLTYNDSTNSYVGTISLKHSEIAHIEGLPENTRYRVIEKQSEEFKSVPTNSEGTIEANKSKEVLYTNYRLEEVKRPNIEVQKDQYIGSNSTITNSSVKVENGDTITYSIRVTNTGNEIAKKVILKDTIPQYLELVEGSITPKEDSSYDDTTRTITWNLGDIGFEERGNYKTATFTVKVPERDGFTYYENKATAYEEDSSNNKVDSNIVNAYEFEENSKSPAVLLEKEQSVGFNGTRTKDVQLVKDGDTVTYYLTVKNIGNVDVEDIIITDQVRDGLLLVNNSISDKGIYNSGTRTITWNIEKLEVGKSKTVDFTVIIPEVDNATTWTNTASATYKDGPNGGVTSDTVRVNEVIESTDTEAPEITKPNLDLNKRQSLTYSNFTDQFIQYDEDNNLITYELTVRNTGTAKATNVIISDTIPSGTTLVEGSIYPDGNVNNGVITWNIGDLDIDSSVTVNFTVQANDLSTVVRNTANVTDTEGDSTASNTVTAGPDSGYSDDTLSPEWPGTTDPGTSDETLSPGGADEGSDNNQNSNNNNNYTDNTESPSGSNNSSNTTNKVNNSTTSSADDINRTVTNTTNNTTRNTSVTTESPKTGVVTAIGLWLTLLGGAGTGLFVERKRKNK